MNIPHIKDAREGDIVTFKRMGATITGPAHVVQEHGRYHFIEVGDVLVGGVRVWSRREGMLRGVEMVSIEREIPPATLADMQAPEGYEWLPIDACDKFRISRAQIVVQTVKDRGNPAGTHWGLFRKENA